MGMYTEFHFNAELKENTPKTVINTLSHMVKGEDTDPLDHSLFKTSRWKSMLTCDSYYFAADTHSTLRYDASSRRYYLCIRCNLKNYDSEIEAFVDWIMPYVAGEDGDFLGFYRCEDTQVPMGIYLQKAMTYTLEQKEE